MDLGPIYDLIRSETESLGHHATAAYEVPGGRLRVHHGGQPHHLRPPVQGP
jgi:hypothetical protein